MTDKSENPSTLLGSIQSEVAVEASPMLEFLARNARLIIAGILLFIAAIGGYGLYVWQSGKALRAEQEAFGRIMVMTDAPKRLEALTAYVAKAPQATRFSALFALAQTAGQTQKHEEAYKAWEQLRGLDPSMKVPATFGMAQALMAQDKPKEALALYEGLLQGIKDADVANVNSRIAILSENMGDYKRAITACEAVLAKPAQPEDVSFWTQKAAVLRLKLEGK